MSIIYRSTGKQHPEGMTLEAEMSGEGIQYWWVYGRNRREVSIEHLVEQGYYEKIEVPVLNSREREVIRNMKDNPKTANLSTLQVEALRQALRVIDYYQKGNS